MHAQEDHVLDAAGFEHVPDFNTARADRITIADDETFVLPLPRCSRIAAHFFEFLSPLGMFFGIIILTTIGLIDRVFAFLFFGNLVAPCANVLGQIRRLGRSLCEGAAWMILVEIHAVTGRVNDQHALGAGMFKNLIHTRHQLADALHCVEAVMQIPHVADDDGRLGSFPRFLGSDQFILARLRLGILAKLFGHIEAGIGIVRCRIGEGCVGCRRQQGDD